MIPLASEVIFVQLLLYRLFVFAALRRIGRSSSKEYDYLPSVVLALLCTGLLATARSVPDAFDNLGEGAASLLHDILSIRSLLRILD